MSKLLKCFFKIANILGYPLGNYVSAKGIGIINDIVYDNSNPYLLKADLYYPLSRSQEKLPVFINVHGGGFVHGDKKYRHGFSITMARLGYFVMNVNYGLCPEYQFPCFINNIIDSINWLHQKSETYGLDPKRFVLSGDSSGAFICAITAGAITNSQFSRQIEAHKCSAKLASVILFCGLYDLETLSKKSILSKNINYSKTVTGKSMEELQKKGLIYIVHPDNYVTPNYPPTFVCHSTKDLLCGGTSDILLDNLVKHSIIHEEFKTNDPFDIHCFHLKPFIKNSRICIDKANCFIMNVL